MKILLTGAEGQVGREITEALWTEKAVELLRFSRSALDITKAEAVQEVFALHKPAVVINAAAYTAVDRAEQEKEQAFAVNREGVKNLALACRQWDVPLIHLSTDYVFDGDKTVPYTEEDERAPLGVYGDSKAAGEKILEETWEKHFIVRISWVFGRYGHNFVKTILRLAKERETLSVVADQIGSPTAAREVASLLSDLAEKTTQENPVWGTYHFCGGRPVSWHEFAKTIVKHAGKKVSLRCHTILPITTAEYPTPAKRPKNSQLNADKIQKTYNISAGDWEKSLVQVLGELEHELR